MVATHIIIISINDINNKQAMFIVKFRADKKGHFIFYTVVVLGVYLRHYTFYLIVNNWICYLNCVFMHYLFSTLVYSWLEINEMAHNVNIKTMCRKKETCREITKD